MTQMTIREIADAWKDMKRPYVKRSTYAAYVLTLENHLLPYFGDMTNLTEPIVQSFVHKKLHAGLSVKTIKDIIMVLKMIMKYGAKNMWISPMDWDIKYPASTISSGIEVLTVANHFSCHVISRLLAKLSLLHPKAPYRSGLVFWIPSFICSFFVPRI